MESSELTSMTLLELSGLIGRRQVSPQEVTRAYLERIDDLNPRLNAYITVTADEALADARRAGEEIAAGQRRGPLHGIPIGLKDLYETKGVRTTAGSKILADWVPDRDAHTVSLLRQAGAVFLGKLNMHEWAMGGTSINPHYGPVRNPWSLECIPGGSSGGSGAALSAGLCAAATGSDTAGSIRIPASLCGIVGIKPTYGLVSLRGIVPLSSSLDHAGPMARTVADCALVLEAMAGPDPDDPFSAGREAEAYSQGLDRGARGLRVGLPTNYFFEGADPEVAATVLKAAAMLSDLGAQVMELVVPAIEKTEAVGMPCLMGESYAYHQRYLRERPDDYGPQVLGMLRSRENLSAAEYINAQWARADYSRQFLSIFDQVDVMVSPTSLIPAATIESCEAEPTGFALIHNTLPFDLTGQPALSVPCGFTEGGLPIGLQIAGRRFDEATVLRLGAAYEAATDWHKRMPPL